MRLISLLLFTFLLNQSSSSQIYELWGTTSGGHPEDDGVNVLNDTGVLFSLGENESDYSVKYALKYDGRRPNFGAPIQADNGKFYGTARFGGIHDDGVLFEYEKEFGHFRKLFDFEAFDSGKEPFGNVFQASNGKIYGTTKQGGDFDHGVFFEYDLTNGTFTKIQDFLDDDTGKFPYGAPYEAQPGKLIGMTHSGGMFNQGVIYEYDFNTEEFQVLLDFSSVDTGGHPQVDFIEADNGKLYGVTFDGGAANNGVLFEYDAELNTLTKLHDFSSVENGMFPVCKLVQGDNGNLYGTTSQGGINNHGVLFEYNLTSNTFTKLVDFDSAITGQSPSGGLVQGTNGKLYGSTQFGGSNTSGVVFSYDLEGSEFLIVHQFDDGFSGENPIGGLAMANDGELLGMSSLGGNGDFGTLYSINPDTDSFRKYIDFEGTNGRDFNGSLIQTDDGLVYGVAKLGGIHDFGVLFEFNVASDTYTKKIDFDGENIGALPSGKLLEAEDGLLYGVTESGGISGKGVLYAYDRVSNDIDILIEFDSNVNGAKPIGSMIQAANDKLYGLTNEGGEANAGVLYEYDYETSAYIKKHDFDLTNGGYPHGDLLEASDGLLYGMTTGFQGGTTGIIFAFDPITSTTATVHSFDNLLLGVNPHGSLIEVDGLLYGMTAFGGTDGKGVLFSYDPILEDFEKLIDFDGSTNGEHPLGSLIDHNGKLYGTTSEGNDSEHGLIFEFDPQTNVLTVIQQLDGSNGSNPLYGELSVIDVDYEIIIGVEENQQLATPTLFPNPASNRIYFSNGIAEQIELYNSAGSQLMKLNKQSSIDVNHLTSGLYIIVITDSSGEIISERFLKQ